MKRPDFTKLITGAIIVAAVGLAVSGYAVQASQYQSLLSLYSKQQHQLLDNGITPAGPSASTIQQQGATGATGQRGPGPTDAQVQAAVEAFCALHDGCAGMPGVKGADGTASTVPGPAGANSTVPGPTGPQGPKGDDGKDGTAGQSPLSWTYTDRLGTTHTCTRSDPFDASAPTYTCTTNP